MRYNPNREAPLEDSPLYHLLEKFAPEALPNLVVVYFSDLFFDMQAVSLLAAFSWRETADGSKFWIEIHKQICFTESKEQL